jgi:hypothetical protein
MSTRKKKRTVAKKYSVVAMQKDLVPVNDAGPKGPGGHWAQQIEPKGAALLSQLLNPCTIVVKNYGPGTVRLVAQYGDLMDLAPGAVRATYANGEVKVENTGEAPVMIEFDFLPIR